MTSHFYVFSVEPGEFHFGEKLPADARVCGRFASRAEAKHQATQLNRNYLSPIYDVNGTPLTMRERAALGVWCPVEYETALEMGKVVTA
jgi:hypothetical protein